MLKTVVELDLVGYTKVARALQESLPHADGPKAVALLNSQVQDFIHHALGTTGSKRESSLYQTTGDGAILLFDEAVVAHNFAHAIHSRTQKHNATVKSEIAKRWFRIGASTGEVEEHEGGYAGVPIIDAVRLESAASPGQLLVDPRTFEQLPAEIRECYDAEEFVVAKGEVLKGRRSSMVDCKELGACQESCGPSAIRSPFDCRILVADDAQLDRHIVGEACHKVSPELAIRFAEHGVEALQIIKETTIDLVITDLVMPELDGLGLLDRVLQTHADLPVLIMTGKGSEDVAAECLRLGAAGYMPKSRLGLDHNFGNCSHCMLRLA